MAGILSASRRGSLSLEYPNHWMVQSRRMPIHRMQVTDSAEERVLQTINIYSICGPEPYPVAVRKNARGFVLRDLEENPVPLKDRELANLAGMSKSFFSRVAKQLISKGTIQRSPEGLGPVKEPEIDRPKTEKVSVTETSGVAGFLFSFASSLVPDPDFEGERATIEELKPDWYEHKKVADTDIANAVKRGRNGVVTWWKSRGYLIDKKSKRKNNQSVVPSSEVEAAPKQPTDRSIDHFPTPPEPPPVVRDPLPPIEPPAEPSPSEPAAVPAPAAEVRKELQEFLEARYPDIPSAVPAAVVDELAVKARDPDGVAHFKQWCISNVKPGKPKFWRYFLSVMDSSLPERENWLKRFQPPEPAQPSEAETRELAKQNIRKMWKHRDDPMFSQWLKEEEERDPELYKEALRDVAPD